MSQSSVPTEFQYVLSNLSSSSLELIKQTYKKLSPDFQTEFEAYSHALYEIMRNNAAKDNTIQYLAVKIWFICGHLDWILDVGSRLSHSGAKAYYALALLFKGDSKHAIDILESLKSRDPYFRMEILGLLSFCYSVTRKYKKVELIFKEIKQVQSLPFFKNNPLIAQEGYVWGLTRYAYTIRAMGDLERALEMIEQAQQFSLELNSRHLQILALLIFGQCLENIGQYSSAFEKYDMALDLSMEISARPFQSLLFNRIGLAMGGSGDFETAYEYFEKSFNTAREIGADWLKIGPLGNLAGYKRSRGNFKSAIEDLEEVLKFSEGFGDKKDAFNAYLALADLYREMGEKEKSQEYYWKGLLLGINLGFFQIEGIVDISDED